MSGVTGDIIKEWYTPGKSSNSFYKEQTMEVDGTRSYVHNENVDGIYYYVDKKSNSIKIGELNR